MATFAKTVVALGTFGAIVLSNAAPVMAQYYYPYPPYPPPPPPRPYYYGPGPRYYPPSPRWNTWNGCPPRFTVQGGLCKPYRGY
jgi:hypothetical protein